MEANTTELEPPYKITVAFDLIRGSPNKWDRKRFFSDESHRTLLYITSKNGNRWCYEYGGWDSKTSEGYFDGLEEDEKIIAYGQCADSLFAGLKILFPPIPQPELGGDE